jgi:hypothetical protein
MPDSSEEEHAMAACGLADWSRFQTPRWAIVILTLAAIVVGGGTPNALAYRGRSRGRSSAAAAAAMKKRTIAQLQQQVAQAKQILADASTKGALSQQQVNAAASKLSGIHQELVDARASAAEARKTLHEIEKEILDEQKEDSEYAIAIKAVAEAKEELNRVVHSYAKLPQEGGRSAEAHRFFELSKMSPEERKALEADAAYLEAKGSVARGAKVIDGIKKGLFEADSQWVEASKDLAAAEQAAHDADRHASTVGVGSLGVRQDARNAQQVAAQAQAIIAQGEAQLRALGASSSPAMASGKK